MTFDKALRATNNSGLQPALDWLEAHANDEGIDDPIDTSAAAPSDEPATDNAAPAATSDQPAQSLVCNECGKQFKSAELAQYHATKSGHADFAESTEAVKPLTEEEKKEKLDELQQRITEKRKMREDAEKAEQRQNELLRRKAGQDMTEQNERLKELTMKRELEKQKREKEDDKRAAQRIKDQIEQDKRDRAVRIALEKAERDGTSTIAANQAEENAAPSMLQAGVPKITTSSNQTRLQIRSMLQSSKGGPSAPLTHVFAADQTLKDVIDYIKQEMPHIGSHFKLSMSFPRKDFDSHHHSKTLKELGLVPNAALILTN
ncbi:hypothetical protein H4R26_001284 [Coemansia thaxteri]|uniref:UBX domain-containing protein n=1 Tax=Coemansia thaxteri TaxID=2663907 RepID=A0A9W8BG96_9FUNG|nr:hypothetical protein H4R26_001284 [Coemansia thaxteri]